MFIDRMSKIKFNPMNYKFFKLEELCCIILIFVELHIPVYLLQYLENANNLKMIEI